MIRTIISNIRIFVCGIGIVLLLPIFFVFGQRDSLVDEILENPLFLPLQDIDSTRITLESLQENMDDLMLRHNYLKKNINQQDETIQKLSMDIDTVIDEIRSTQNDLDVALLAMQQLTQDIHDTEQKKLQLEKDFLLSKQQLQGYIDVFYRLSNEIYDDTTTTTSISTTKLLIKADSLFEGIQDHDIILLLTHTIQDLIQRIDDLHTQTTAYLESLNILYGQQQQKQNELHSLLEQLQQQEQNLKELFQQVQLQQAQTQDEVRTLQSTKVSIEKKVQILSQPKSTQISDIVAKISIRDDLDDNGRYVGRPVFPHQTTANFLESFYTDETGHLGLQVLSNTPIYSPAPGMIYSIQESDNGIMILLVHKHGYMTAVGPFVSLKIKQGAYVERGQILGFAKRTTVAGITKHHTLVSMQVWKDGVVIDPLHALDLSIFKSKIQLPESFHTKYDDDMFARTIEPSSSFIISGKDIPTRVARFLTRFAHAPFHNLQLWLDGNKGTDIDPYFGICIGRAETSYQNFKTENNIGNVGNNDRGDTVVFETPADGIRALYNVLNNKFLGHYHTMDQLSRYGNSDGFIYASSPYNWQRNIMYCMSMLYDYNIPETFPFRVK